MGQIWCHAAQGFCPNNDICDILSSFNSVTHMQGQGFYVNERLPFARVVSPENSQDFYLFFNWLYFFQSLSMIFDGVSSNVDKVLSVMLWSQFSLTFLQTQKEYFFSSHNLWLLLYWLGQSLWSFERCSFE